MLTNLMSRRASAAVFAATLFALPAAMQAQTARTRATGAWMMFINQDTTPPDKCAHALYLYADGSADGPATSLPSKDNPFAEGGLKGEWNFDGTTVKFGFTRIVITGDGKELGLERVQFTMRWNGDQMIGSGTGELFDIDGNSLGTVPLRVRLIRVLTQ
ncbi:MAG: hypothetical protein U0Q16_22585 [Bryobacteraceae bacterium]